MAKRKAMISKPVPTVVVGIDPGLEGAIAAIDVQRPEQTEVVGFAEVIKARGQERRDAIPRLVWTTILGFLMMGKVPLIFVEHSYAWAKLSENTGRILGALSVLEGGIPYTLVRPVEWKRKFNLLRQSKNASIRLARKLYPKVKFKTHDEAEALLIAHYGLETIRGKVK